MTRKQATLFGDDSRDTKGQHARGKTRSTSFVSSVWSFPDLGGGSSSYRWYGTLPIDLLERLFSLYAPTGTEKIIDGFLGSGVTLQVAARLGNPTVGVDCNPLACLVAEARLNPGKDQHRTLSAAMRVASNFAADAEPRNFAAFARALRSSRYEYTRKWFRTDAIKMALRLLATVGEVEDIAAQRLLFVASAQAIREVANIDPRCTHHLVTKLKPYKNPMPAWHARVGELANSAAGSATHKCRVVQGSILTDITGTFDLGIFHPPYLGVIHYHLIHRLATDLLGIAAEIGGAESLVKYSWAYEHLRAADFSTDDAGRYSASVQLLAHRARTLFRDGSRCVVIIGDQRHKSLLRHPFTDIIAKFENNGFALEENFIWVLQNNGGMHVLRRGHFIDHNYILVFRRLHDS